MNFSAMSWCHLLLLLWLLFIVCESAQDCAWSNEGCSTDGECCSKSCHKAHEGTNARCRHSTLGEPCVFDYHCKDTLTCGKHFKCCSPFWKMCTNSSHCCEEEHVCRPVDGFLYNRCLYPISGVSTTTSSVIFTVTSVLFTAALTLLPNLPVYFGVD